MAQDDDHSIITTAKRSSCNQRTSRSKPSTGVILNSILLTSHVQLYKKAIRLLDQDFVSCCTIFVSSGNADSGELPDSALGLVAYGLAITGIQALRL